MSRDDRGQALAVMIAILGFAALVVVSLEMADARLLTRLRAQRAAEAAAEAAGAVVADRLVELLECDLDDRRGPCGDVIARALAERGTLVPRAEGAARAVLSPWRGELVRLLLERRANELSVRAEVRVSDTIGIARVGVRAP